MRHMHSLVALLAVSSAAGAAAQQPAGADWRVNFDISWNGTPPSRFTLQTPATGGIEFRPAGQPLTINERVPNGHDDYRLVAHFPDVSHGFAVLARSGQPSYRLRLELPQGLQCDNRPVARIVQDSRSSEAERLANAGLAASYLLSRRTNSCSPTNTNRLRAAVVDSHCNLATHTNAFSVPDIPWADHQRRAIDCRKVVRVRIVGHIFRRAGAEAEQRQYAALEGSILELRALYEAPEWVPAFTSARLDENNFRHLEVESLYNRTVPLRDTGDLSGAAPFAARLAALADRFDYREAFRRASLDPSDARDIDRRIREALQTPEPGPAPEQPRD